MHGRRPSLGPLHLVVEYFILILHTRHERILRQGIVAAAVLLVRTIDLLFQRLDIGRKKTIELEVLPFVRREC